MTAIDRLAERMGIEPEFQDAARQLRKTSAETKRALLGAMGLKVESEADARAALAEFDRADWLRPLPPVLVLRGETPRIGIAVTLPAGTDAIEWRLSEEAGGELAGSARFAELPRLGGTRIDGHAIERRRLTLTHPAAHGYHRFRIAAEGGIAAEMPLIVAPEHCHLPEGLGAEQPLWGVAAQLYLLRSAGNWGIGDFSDLRRLAEIAADFDASVIGLNPLHAMFLDRPEHASPYSPASRVFLNALYIDVTAIAEWSASDGVPPEARRSREAPLVDYLAVTESKLPVLELLFRRFTERADPERRAAFAAFRREGGEALERFCRFQALREHFAREGRPPDWVQWPEAYRDAGSREVARFAEDHRARIDFLAWLQWLADAQLAAAAETARGRGMAVGLYRDLAVGADMAGAETWSRPDVVVAGASVGAPPDLFNPAGQDWGLPPFSPEALRRDGYAGFIELVRANMRHAGGLRIDHVMALQHLYWIPQGASAADGAYVSYPMEDLLGILALESRRHRCLVVGEDLGTVPEGFRERMQAAGILSYRVLAFEQDEDGRFLSPEDYPRLALATLGSHDLATLRGWWEGRDIALKEKYGRYRDAAEAEEHRALRARDRAALLDALRAVGADLPDGFGPDSAYDIGLSHAAHGFMARSAAGLAMAQLDDLTDEGEQVNLPGTTGEHPNWRRKHSLTLEEIAADPTFRGIAAILAEARPSSGRRRHPPSRTPAWEHPNARGDRRA